jgi:hypothetical protein
MGHSIVVFAVFDAVSTSAIRDAEHRLLVPDDDSSMDP